MECDCKKHQEGFAPKVVIPEQKCCPVMFRLVKISASMGDDTVIKPENGLYRNVILNYEANNHTYLYSSDGVPTRLNNGMTNYDEATNLPKINSVTLIGNKTSADLRLADAPKVITIKSGNVSWEGADSAEDVYNFFVNRGKVNIIFEGAENDGYQLITAAYIEDEQKLMGVVVAAPTDHFETTEFNGAALLGVMTLYTENKAVDVGEIDLQPKLFITDFTGLDLSYNELSGVPATTYSIGMVKPAGGLNIKSDGTLTTEARVFDTVADMKAAADLTAGDYAQTLGFYTVGDGGGAIYQITDTGTADEMGVIAVGALYANIVVQNQAVNAKQFGAKGDGITDDTSNISAAIAYVDSGTTISFSKATYLCNISCDKSVNFDFCGATLISKTSNPIIKITGDKSSSGYTLASNLSRGDKDMTIQGGAPVSLQAGDYILLRDDTVRPSDSLANINEEVHQIEAIAGDVVTIKDFVRFPKAVATSTVNIYKLDMVHDVDIRNVNIYDDSHGSTGLAFVYAENVTASNIHARHMNNPGIAFISCNNIVLDGFSAKDPQAVDAGHGYGVLIDHGTNNFAISNGTANKARHAVDCASCFDGNIKNVKSYNTQSTSFPLSHNSFSSDITIEDCFAETDYYGYGISSQGVTNYYDMTACNFNIINCVANIENKTVNSSGCRIQLPAQDCTIENFTVKGKVSNTYGVGISLVPINNRILVNNLKAYNVYRGVILEGNAVAEDDGMYYNKFINTYIENATFGFRFSNTKEIYIDRVNTNNVRSLIETGVYDVNKTNPLKFFNLTNGIFKSLTNLMVFNNQNYISPTYIIGKINNINLNTAQGNYTLVATEGGKILDNLTAMYARCSSPDGIILPVRSNSNVTLGTDFIARGFTVYQTVTIVNYGTKDITLPSSDLIENIGGSTYTLEAGHSMKYIWNGVIWKQM